MKTFIIAAMTADGFIAKDESHAALWTSKEDKARFVKLTKEAGVIVMGSTTFATLPRPLKDRHNVVYTRNPEKFTADPKYTGVEITNEDPAILVKKFADLGKPGLAICGGAQIYTLFMKVHVVQKLYLTIEPIVFGKGIRLFNEEVLFNLKLVSSETTPGGTVFLEYDVDYSGTDIPGGAK